MNSRQIKEHRVEQTPRGRFAVIAPSGEVVHEFIDSAAAIMAAAALDAEPVRNVFVLGRWMPQPVLADLPHPGPLPNERVEDLAA